jgi:hypothetical protein
MVAFPFDLKEYDAVATIARRRALVANGYRLVEVRGKGPSRTIGNTPRLVRAT